MKLITICLIFAFALSGCSYPVARDDFSVMGKDIFSNLIRNAYSEVNLSGDSYGTKGVGTIDKSKLKSLSTNVLSSKNRNALIQVFEENEGKCSPFEPGGKLHCEVFRRWRLTNIGGETNTNGWIKPSVKIEFIFYFKDNDIQQNFDLI